MSIKKPKIAGTIPVIVAVLVTLTLFFIPLDFRYEPQLLLGPLTTIFLAILPLVVSVYAANAFFRFGSARVLLLGCGTLALGWGSLLAGLIVEKAGFPNHFVTIQNIGALLGGLFHFCGSIGIVDEKLKKIGQNHTLGTILTFYLSIVTFLCIVAVGSLFELTPPFFLGGQEEGPTLLRQSVLLIAIGLYASSGIAFLRFYRVSGKDFFYWYSLALFLLALGLASFLMQKSLGSLISWTGRISMYLSSIYLMLVVYETMRSAKQKGLSVEMALSFFFKDMEQNYRALLESISDAVFCFDRAFQVFLCNRQAEALLGRPRKEIVGADLLDLLDLSKEKNLSTALRKFLSEDVTQASFEAWLIKGQGSFVPVEYSLSKQGTGKELTILAMVRDITQRKQMEEMLRQNNEELELRVAQRTGQLAELNKALQEEIEERRQVERELRKRKDHFRMLFKNMVQGVFYQNRDGMLLDVNDSALKFFGLTRQEFLDRDSFSPHWKVISEDGFELPPVEHPSMLALRTGKPVRDKIAGVANPKTGDIRWLVINALPEFEEGESEPSQVCVTVHDITGIKQMERELRTARDDLEKRVEERTLELQKTHSQLLHAEKLSAIGGLSASIAHEFNNPLQSVMTVMKGIHLNAALHQDEKILMDLALKECERMRDLIRNLQDFNRPTSGHMSQVDLHAAMDSILIFGKYRYKRKNILIKKEYAPALPIVRAVADQIKQVFLNLLNNAVDACEEVGGGTITIGTSVCDSSSVRITVQDTGKGIPAETVPRIFEPFFTTKPAIKGTGLGLSVCSDIVKSHGGCITVKSKPGLGTTFTVVLPIPGNRQESTDQATSLFCDKPAFNDTLPARSSDEGP